MHLMTPLHIFLIICPSSCLQCEERENYSGGSIWIRIKSCLGKTDPWVDRHIGLITIHSPVPYGGGGGGRVIKWGGHKYIRHVSCVFYIMSSGLYIGKVLTYFLPKREKSYISGKKEKQMLVSEHCSLVFINKFRNPYTWFLVPLDLEFTYSN